MGAPDRRRSCSRGGWILFRAECEYNCEFNGNGKFNNNGDGNCKSNVATASLAAWKGLRVEAVEFEGVTFGAKDPLPGLLAQKAGEALEPAKVTASVRRLFASGRYRDIRVEGVREGAGMRLIYVGVPRYFVGRVTIVGVKDERLASLLEYATKLQPGTDYNEAEIPAATEGVRQALASNGYYEPAIAVKTTVDEAGGQVNAEYTVSVGPQARVGKISVEGNDPGMTAEEVRQKGRLKLGSKVTRETTSNALTRLRAQYEKRDRLEATTSLRTRDLRQGAQAGGLQLHREPRAAGEGGGGGREVLQGAAEAAVADLPGGDDRQRPAERRDVQHQGLPVSGGLLRRDGLGEGGGRGLRDDRERDESGHRLEQGDGAGERGVLGGEGRKAQGWVGDDFGQPLLRHATC